MPIYEYKCDGCGEVFEVRQKFSDEPVTVHEKCGGPVHKLLSAPSFQFKGSGFYITDYPKEGSGGRKSSSSESKNSESKSSSDAPAKTETKSTESKPAASTPSKSE